MPKCFAIVESFTHTSNIYRSSEKRGSNVVKVVVVVVVFVCEVGLNRNLNRLFDCHFSLSDVCLFFQTMLWNINNIGELTTTVIVVTRHDSSVFTWQSLGTISILLLPLSIGNNHCVTTDPKR